MQNAKSRKSREAKAVAKGQPLLRDFFASCVFRFAKNYLSKGYSLCLGAFCAKAQKCTFCKGTFGALLRSSAKALDQHLGQAQMLGWLVAF